MTDTVNNAEILKTAPSQIAGAPNPLVKKVVDMSRKAKSIIDAKNTEIEELKKDKENLLNQIEELKKNEDLGDMSHKRKKVEE